MEPLAEGKLHRGAAGAVSVLRLGRLGRRRRRLAPGGRNLFGILQVGVQGRLGGLTLTELELRCSPDSAAAAAADGAAAEDDDDDDVDGRAAATAAAAAASAAAAAAAAGRFRARPSTSPDPRSRRCGWMSPYCACSALTLLNASPLGAV